MNSSYIFNFHTLKELFFPFFFVNSRDSKKFLESNTNLTKLCIPVCVRKYFKFKPRLDDQCDLNTWLSHLKVKLNQISYFTSYWYIIYKKKKMLIQWFLEEKNSSADFNLAWVYTKEIKETVLMIVESWNQSKEEVFSTFCIWNWKP